jgi:hypothetical protein
MRTRAAVVVAAVFLSLGSALCAPAGAVEPAVLAAFERSLDPLEKAILASVLSNPANDAEFTADMVEARRDAAGLQAAYAKWRMKIAQFATSDRNAPNPNLEGTYRTYPEMLTPAIRGYLSRRLRDLRERGAAGDRQAQEAFDTLRDYLASVQSSLDDDGKLSWYTKRVVAGIMDRYRSELVEYLGTANARNGLRDGPAAAETLQRRRQAASTAAQEEEQRRRQAAAAAEAERQRVERERQDAERRRREQASAPVGGEPAEPAPPVREEPVREQPRPEPVVPPREPVVTETPEQRTAREQAEAAERTARAGAPGQVFDGGGLVVGEPPVGGVVAVPPGEAGQRTGSGLAPSTGQNGPGGGLVGSVPSPGADDELLSSIRGGPSGRGSKNWMEKIPAVAGIVLGAVIGLLVAGPLGLVIGGLLGLFAGNWAGKKLLQ